MKFMFTPADPTKVLKAKVILIKLKKKNFVLCNLVVGYDYRIKNFCTKKKINIFICKSCIN